MAKRDFKMVLRWSIGLASAIWLAWAPTTGAADSAPTRKTAEAAYEAGDVVSARRHFATLAEIGDMVALARLTEILTRQEGGPAGQDASSFLLKLAAVTGQASAVAPLKERAAAGEAAAIYAIGTLQEHGIHMPKDFEAALASYRRAAEAGYPMAQNDMGALYEAGRGVPQDYEQARMWYERAASNGSGLGYLNIGALYAEGRGVPRDLGIALQHFATAAEYGNGMAQYNIAVIYAQGQFFERDLVKALYWFVLAEHNGAESATQVIDTLIEHMSEEQLQATERMLKGAR